MAKLSKKLSKKKKETGIVPTTLSKKLTKEKPKAEKKLSILEMAEKAITDKYGSESIMRLTDHIGKDVPVAFSTGVADLDRCIGIGGLPSDRIIEIYGPESSGKTTLALHMIAHAQKTGGLGVFIDAEHAVDVNYATKLGVNVDELLISQPNCGEEALDICETFVKIFKTAKIKGVYNAIVIDSVAALTPKAEIEGNVDDKYVGTQARMMSQYLRKLVHSLNGTNTVVIFLNQIRNKISFGGFGPKETTTGGNALKFYASIRIDIRRIGSEKEGDNVVANKVKVKVVKNKVAPPFKEFEGVIVFNKGFYTDPMRTIYDTVVASKEIEIQGKWFVLPNKKKFMGIKVFRKLYEDPEHKKVIDKIIEKES